MQSEASVILISVPCTYKSSVNFQLKDHIYILILIKGWDAIRIKQDCEVNKTTAASLHTVNTGEYVEQIKEMKPKW